MNKRTLVILIILSILILGAIRKWGAPVLEKKQNGQQHVICHQDQTVVYENTVKFKDIRLSVNPPGVVIFNDNSEQIVGIYNAACVITRLDKTS